MIVLFVVVAVLAIFVAVLVTRANARRDAALRAETEHARQVAEEAKCVTPPAAQPKAKRKTRR